MLGGQSRDCAFAELLVGGDVGIAVSQPLAQLDDLVLQPPNLFFPLVVVDVEGALAIAGNLTLDAGTLELRMADDGTQVTVGEIAFIDGATLKLDFSELAPASGSQFVLLSANRLSGTFSSVESDVAVDLSYSGQRVTATVR